MKRPASHSPPSLTPPPSKRKCVQSTPESDVTHSLTTNGSGVRRANGRSSASSRGSTASTPPASPARRGRGSSATPSEPPESPTTRRSTRLRNTHLPFKLFWLLFRIIVHWRFMSSRLLVLDPSSSYNQLIHTLPAFILNSLHSIQYWQYSLFVAPGSLKVCVCRKK